MGLGDRVATGVGTTWAKNLRLLNDAAYEVLRRGDLPIIGVNLALPVIESAGQETYERIMIPLSLALTERCDAVLRIDGVSQGADDEVRMFQARGRPVFRSVEEIPPGQSATRSDTVANR